MTEKRFEVYKVSGNFGEWEVEDTLTDTVVMDKIIHKYLADRLCEKLNELSDENKELKEIIVFQRDTIKRDNKWENKAIGEINELRKENEQLKKENKELEEELDCIWDSYENYYGMSIRNAEWYGFKGDME